MEFSYHFPEEAQIPSPALVFYQDILLKNTETAIQIAHSPQQLWPHVKSHKSSIFTQIQVDMGITQFKCATLAEAQMVAETTAKKILLAYPLVGPNIQHFIQLIQSFPDKEFYALGDDLEVLAALGKAALQQGLTIPCLADVNTGMNRTGVSFDNLLPFYRKLNQIPGLSAAGLHCYDGDRHEKAEGEREERVLATIAQVNCILEKCKAEQLPCPILIMGGSPSFPCYAKHQNKIAAPNCFFSPGTVFLYDAGYTAQFPDLPYLPGAAILTRIVSHPKEGWFTLDTGYKAISAEQTTPGILPELPHAKPFFQSEEHWTYAMEEGLEHQRPAIGTLLYLIPWHICPTCALHEYAYCVSDGHLKGKWPITARNRTSAVMP